ncbi:MAG: FAD:protein FMN transferase [Rikenellaceae bacterium]
MAKILRVFTLILLVFSVIGCSESEELKKYTISGFAQGTTYSIVYLDTKESVKKSFISKNLSDFDRSCSLYNPASLINKINSGETDSLDANIENCIQIAEIISKESDGLYDITVKPLVEAYGFAAKEGLESINIDSLMQYVGYQKLSVDSGRLIREKGVEIDLNSIAQGYSVDFIAAKFDSLAIENYLIEIGGEIFCRGKNARGENWNIGIDKPIDGNFSPGENLQTIIALESGRGLATSGNYRKFHIDKDGNRVNHTVNPLTGESSTTQVLSATIIASSAALADGYATAIMAMGVEKGIEFLQSNPQLQAYIVYSEGDENLVFEQL